MAVRKAKVLALPALAVLVGAEARGQDDPAMPDVRWSFDDPYAVVIRDLVQGRFPARVGGCNTIVFRLAGAPRGPHPEVALELAVRGRSAACHSGSERVKRTPSAECRRIPHFGHMAAIQPQSWPGAQQTNRTPRALQHRDNCHSLRHAYGHPRRSTATSTRRRQLATATSVLRPPCQDKFIAKGLGRLDHCCRVYEAWYNVHRPHSSLDNEVIGKGFVPAPESVEEKHGVVCESWLGGVLRHYRGAAA